MSLLDDEKVVEGKEQKERTDLCEELAALDWTIRVIDMASRQIHGEEKGQASICYTSISYVLWWTASGWMGMLFFLSCSRSHIPRRVLNYPVGERSGMEATENQHVIISKPPKRSLTPIVLHAPLLSLSRKIMT